MPKSFSIDAVQFPISAETELRREVRTHTGSDEEADSVVRSIARLGNDGSIDRYDVTPVKQRAHVRAIEVAWSVRAVRP